MVHALADTVGPALRARFDYRRFAERQCRVLLVDAGYYLVDETHAALTARGHTVERIIAPSSGADHASFVRTLLLRAAALRPDFVLTINHFGFDAEGHLASLLDRLELPTAVWYVDDPTPILGSAQGLATEHTATFVWDRSYLTSLASQGFADSRWLPLAVDRKRLASPSAEAKASRALRLLFVGSSWGPLIDKARARLTTRQAAACVSAIGRLTRDGRAPRAELLQLAGCGSSTIDASNRQARADTLAFIQRAASRDWRHEVLAALPAEQLTIVGDREWRTLLPDAQHLSASDYHSETTSLYRRAAVTLNVTSRQMPTAINQRAFDVPAAGGFVLQDAQADLAELFPADAIASFETPDEARDKVAFYLRDDAARTRITQRAVEVIAHTHTYEHRIDTMFEGLRSRFAG